MNTPSLGKVGRKSLKEPRQKEIIKAFYKLAKKEGLENASIAKTAESININPSLVIHYFRTKEHMVYSLVEYILDKYQLIFNVPVNANDTPLQVLLKVIDNIFSKKWNTLFDDGVSYSCYSLTFQDKIIRQKYKLLLDTLRAHLAGLIAPCIENGSISIKDPVPVADIIFVLVDGAYYYLSLTDNKEEYNTKLLEYKNKAIELLHIRSRKI
jgi:AcrR family transcriptional regulator